MALAQRRSEMTPRDELSHTRWRTSSLTNGGEACVEIASTSAFVAVRDSKDPQGPTLLFRPATFAAFLNKTKTDGF
jgi:Domain of unknown function (DUF397)